MKKTINAFELKIVCMVMMIFGLVLQVWCRFRVMAAPDNQPEWVSMLFFAGTVLYLASFPLSAFLLVEAARKTSDKKKLLLCLFVAAVAAELPMDMASYGFAQIKLWGQSQNYFFTMVLGLLALYAVDRINVKFGAGSTKANLSSLPVYLLATCGAVLLRTELSSVGVLTILALSVFYGNKIVSLLTVAVLYVTFISTAGQSNLAGLEYIPALSLLVTWRYDGERGTQNTRTRVLFYAAYPIVYCIMSGILG